MAEKGDERTATERPRGRTLPLNSRRLTATTVQQITRALELPHAAPVEDTRQMIDGKREELGREPQNTQVVLAEQDTGKVTVGLRDEEGVFLEVLPQEE